MKVSWQTRTSRSLLSSIFACGNLFPYSITTSDELVLHDGTADRGESPLYRFPEHLDHETISFAHFSLLAHVVNNASLLGYCSALTQAAGACKVEEVEMLIRLL